MDGQSVLHHFYPLLCSSNRLSPYPVTVEVNGKPITINTGDTNEFSEFFAPLDAKVPTSFLKAEKEISIKAQKGATITSVQLVTHSLVK
jgi:hypothetical protein